LDVINEGFRVAHIAIFEPFIKLPDKSYLLHRIGKLDGFRLSDAGFKVTAEVYAKHKEEVKKAWANENAGEPLSPAHQKIVDDLRDLHKQLREAREREAKSLILTDYQKFLLLANKEALRTGRDTISGAHRRNKAGLPLNQKQHSIVTRMKAGRERGIENSLRNRAENARRNRARLDSEVSVFLVYLNIL
jgi:hypothetical protein